MTTATPSRCRFALAGAAAVIAVIVTEPLMLLDTCGRSRGALRQLATASLPAVTA